MNDFWGLARICDGGQLQTIHLKPHRIGSMRAASFYKELHSNLCLYLNTQFFFPFFNTHRFLFSHKIKLTFHLFITQRFSYSYKDNIPIIVSLNKISKIHQFVSKNFTSTEWPWFALILRRPFSSARLNLCLSFVLTMFLMSSSVKPRYSFRRRISSTQRNPPVYKKS